MNMLRILFVDADTTWLKTARDFFESKNYQVDTATLGKEAQVFLGQNPYFCLVMNTATANHSAMSVLAFVRCRRPGIRVVLTSDEGLQQEINPTELEKLGVSKFMPKPLEFFQLLKYLEEDQSGAISIIKNTVITNQVSAPEEVEATDESFSRCKVDEFFSGSAVFFDIYIRLSEKKFVKILHAGDSFSQDKLRDYREKKNIEHLYFKKSDRKRYLSICQSILKKAIDLDMITSSKKVVLHKNIVEKYVEGIFTEGVHPQLIEQGKEICLLTHNMIQKDKVLAEVLEGLNKFDPTSYSHSFLLGIFSVSAATKFKWNSPLTSEALMMTAMFHDIGKMKLGKEFLALRPEAMTPEQLRAYQSHPVLGSEMLQNFRQLPPAVKVIVSQHHECPDGSGFPLGLKDSKLLTLSSLVSLTDSFVHYMTTAGLRPKAAMDKLLQNQSWRNKYRANLIENFVLVFEDFNQEPSPRE